LQRAARVKPPTAASVETPPGLGYNDRTMPSQLNRRDNRRDTARLPMSLNVMLKGSEGRFIPVKTRDISQDGAFLLTGPTNLDVGDVFELALTLTYAGLERTHQLDGRVVRRAPGGVAVTFEDPDSETYEALLHLVFSHQTAGAY
jgi:hypothetical protein